MKEIRKILVPVDFSENSRMALDRALWLAEKINAHVILFHAFDTPEVTKEPRAWHLLVEKDLLSQVKHNVTRELHEFAKEYDEHKVTIEPELAQGKPFVEIIKAAKRHGVDLIIMGTHGRTGLKHMFIGSVAEKVVRKAPCPVLTVKHPDYRFEMP